MKILITACSRPRSWYEGLINRVLNVERSDACGYWAREPSGFLNVVLNCDAEVLEIA